MLYFHRTVGRQADRHAKTHGVAEVHANTRSLLGGTRNAPNLTCHQTYRALKERGPHRLQPHTMLAAGDHTARILLVHKHTRRSRRLTGLVHETLKALQHYLV